jgi:beta-phosphoglucomutase family hydrolase
LKIPEPGPHIQALIFDLDGTLADTMSLHFMAYKNLLEQYGIAFTPVLFRTLAGIPAVGTIERLNEMFGTTMNPEETAQKKEQEYEKRMDRIQPIKPVVDVVKKYHGKLPMAVGTGGSKRLAWKSLKITGLDKYFEILVASEDVTHPKPHPETFLKCAEYMGVEPSFCHVFEDGDPGMQAARSAGMTATLITNYYPSSLENPEIVEKKGEFPLTKTTPRI